MRQSKHRHLRVLAKTISIVVAIWLSVTSTPAVAKPAFDHPTPQVSFKLDGTTIHSHHKLQLKWALARLGLDEGFKRKQVLKNLMPKILRQLRPALQRNIGIQADNTWLEPRVEQLRIDPAALSTTAWIEFTTHFDFPPSTRTLRFHWAWAHPEEPEINAKLIWSSKTELIRFDASTTSVTWTLPGQPIPPWSRILLFMGATVLLAVSTGRINRQHEAS